jgi:uncharacterized RDD family membrane protein YckC
VPPYAATPPGYRLVPATPQGVPLADFGDRFVAYLIDYLIMAAVIFVPAVVVVVLMFMVFLNDLQATAYSRSGPSPAFFLFYLALILVLIPFQLLVHYLYQVSYQVRRGQTVGKRVAKIKIVSLADGTPMSVTAARKRWLLGSVAGLVGAFAWLDGLWQLWDQPYKQCLHDKWAQTVVVRVSP